MDKAKAIEQHILEKAPEVAEKFKNFVGDLFSLSVELIDATTDKLIASWVQKIDGDMTLKLPAKDGQVDEKAYEFFSQLVTEAMGNRRQVIEIVAKILGLADLLV